MSVRRKELALIGNGMVAQRLLDRLHERGGFDRYAVTVFDEESDAGYNRILLSHVLGGDEPDSIVTKPAAWYAEAGVRLVARSSVRRIDTSARRVVADGGEYPYDLVVLATGSSPVVPPLDGISDGNGELKRGVFVYRTLEGCLRMRAHARPGDNAVVLGGGLLGLEAAKVLADRGLHVTVVHLAGSLMDAQLDSVGGELLRQQVLRSGLFVRTGQTLDSILGDKEVEGVVLDDGKTLAADIVVMACGIRPRVEVARASGIPINKGVLVNDTLATEIPGVYALGECAEHRGRTYGLVAPGWEQADVLADVLTGARPQARYLGSKLYARLKAVGIEVASIGALHAELESDDVVQVIETKKQSYRKLVIRDSQLIGAILVGNTDAAATLIQTFDRGDPLPDDPLESLCTPAFMAAAGAVDAIVCNCNKVARATIVDAITSGAKTMDTLCEATRAGTGCGSCRSDLIDLISRFA